MKVHVCTSRVTVHSTDPDRLSVRTIGIKGDRGEAGTGSLVFNETPDGTIDGTNSTFNLEHSPTSGALVSVNGLVQAPGSGNDYTLSDAIITFTPAAIPQPGDVVLVTYTY